jgi:hypothetical protein
MVIAWIISVWLLSLVVFVALRAYGTRNRRGVDRQQPPGIAELPLQRESWDSPARVRDR